MSKAFKRTIAGCALALTCLAAPQAGAWQEVHQTGDDVTIRVDPRGRAVVEHAISYRVVRGPLRSIELRGVEPNIEPEPDVVVTTEDGRELSAHASTRADRSLRIAVDQPRALLRGRFVFKVRYAVDLVAAQELVRDGAMWRLVWSAPIAREGFDGARTTFVLPAAPSEPRPVRADTGAIDDAVIQTLHRTASEDRLELVRPHVSRGEAVVWTLRVDPKAFPEVSDPRLRPAAPPPLPAPDRAGEALRFAIALVVGAAFALLVAAKDRRVDAMCSLRSASARPLLPLGRRVRAWLAGGAMAAAIALQQADWPTTGAAFVALAMLLAVHRRPNARPRPRGPGRWVALRAEDAFARRKRPCEASVFEWASRRGKLAMIALGAGLASLAAIAHTWGPEWPYWIVLDGLALLPLALTGRFAQLPPDAAVGPAPLLARVHRRLRTRKDARVVPWARFPLGHDTPDELRLIVLPRHSMPGVLGLEVGVAWRVSASGYAPAPEVLVRVQENSCAEARLAALVRGGTRPVPGRKPHERVYRLAAERARAADVVKCVEGLVNELRDRRDASTSREPWAGEERRKPLPAPEPRQPMGGAVWAAS